MNKFPWDEFYATHRCQGSLAAGVPIRFRRENDYSPNSPHAWFLGSIDIDPEWGGYHHHRVAKIKYCPFCGKPMFSPVIPQLDLTQRLAIFKRLRLEGIDYRVFLRHKTFTERGYLHV